MVNGSFEKQDKGQENKERRIRLWERCVMSLWRQLNEEKKKQYLCWRYKERKRRIKGIHHERTYELCQVKSLGVTSSNFTRSVYSKLRLYVFALDPVPYIKSKDWSGSRVRGILPAMDGGSLLRASREKGRRISFLYRRHCNKSSKEH